MSADLPHSVSQSTVTIMGVELVVHQLNTGERIIEADSMNALFEAMGGHNWHPDAIELEALAKVIRPTDTQSARTAV